ncbi:MAG: MerR family transcriptional regulator, partial [Christensenellaceae bacterium]|nr:MerR family transcriptional regulator [Christensenellaceae bacterium]
MSQYTTGELARLCGVSVRTVQFYDSKGILTPSRLSEGGRRLYSRDDLRRLHTICFLREAGFSIGSIGALFDDPHPENIISALLDRQEQALRAELEQQKARLDKVEGIRRELKSIENFSVESLSDIANSMKDKKALRRLRVGMLLTGIPVTALQWVSIILWIAKGICWLFIVWAAVAIVYGTAVSALYYNRVGYICPDCHTQFHPPFREMFFANHTPRMRKLTCPGCGRKGWCVEVYA